MKIYIRNNERVWDMFGNKLVVLDHQEGRVFTLNETAANIWLLLEKEMVLYEILKEISSKYEGKNIDIEVKEALAQMIDLKLVFLRKT